MADLKEEGINADGAGVAYEVGPRFQRAST